MGESNRRAKLNPNYGKLFDLSSYASKEQHCESVSLDFFNVFSSEFKTFAKAKVVPDNFQFICDHSSVWLEQRLQPYAPPDRTCIAEFILTVASQYGSSNFNEQFRNQEYPVSPVVFCWISQVTKNYFTEEVLLDWNLRLHKACEKLSSQGETPSLVKSLLQLTP